MTPLRAGGDLHDGLTVDDNRIPNQARRVQHGTRTLNLDLTDTHQGTN